MIYFYEDKHAQFPITQLKMPEATVYRISLNRGDSDGF